MDLAGEKGGSPQARGAGLPQFALRSKTRKSTIKGGDPCLFASRAGLPQFHYYTGMNHCQPTYIHTITWVSP